MDYPSLEVFLRDLTDCLRNWLPQVSGHEQPDQGDVGQVWGMVIEMARSAPARHKLVFVHGMLPTEVAADAVLTAHVLPYQMTFSRLLLELSESLKHPRKMVLAAYALHALVLEPDRPQTSTGVPAKMSCVEGVLMMHPDVCKLLMGLSTAFCALAGGLPSDARTIAAAGPWQRCNARSADGRRNLSPNHGRRGGRGWVGARRRGYARRGGVRAGANQGAAPGAGEALGAAGCHGGRCQGRRHDRGARRAHAVRGGAGA